MFYEGFEEDYPSEMDVALENGCFVDDDGNWVPLDYAEEYGFDLEELCGMGYDPDDLLYDDDDFDYDDDDDTDDYDDEADDDDYDEEDDDHAAKNDADDAQLNIGEDGDFFASS